MKELLLVFFHLRKVIYKDDVETTAITSKARGSKCSICWKIKEAVCDRANCALK